MKNRMNFLYYLCIVISAVLAFCAFALQPDFSFMSRFAMFAGGSILLVLAVAGILRQDGVALFRTVVSK